MAFRIECTVEDDKLGPVIKMLFEKDIRCKVDVLPLHRGNVLPAPSGNGSERPLRAARRLDIAEIPGLWKAHAKKNGYREKVYAKELQEFTVGLGYSLKSYTNIARLLTKAKLLKKNNKAPGYQIV